MAEFKDSYITEEERKARLIQNLADRPNAMSSYGRAKMSAEDLKKAFDKQFNLVVDRHNLLHKSVEEIRGEAQTERLEFLENRADTVDERLGDPNDANSIEDVIQRVADLESLLDDPIAEDNYDESIGGIRTRVAANEKSISQAQKTIGEIDSSVNAIAGKTNGLEISIENNAKSISGLSDEVRDIEDFLTYNQEDEDNVFLRCYPVGSIYMSVNSTSPATLFGGTWTQLKDRFLIGTGSTYSNGATGGATTHSHSASNMRALFGGDSNSTLKFHFKATAAGSSWTPNKMINVSSSATSDISLRYTGIEVDGNTASVNHMPPYLAVYMWKRTA